MKPCAQCFVCIHYYTEEDGSELKVEELSGSCLDKQYRLDKHSKVHHMASGKDEKIRHETMCTVLCMYIIIQRKMVQS